MCCKLGHFSLVHGIKRKGDYAGHPDEVLVIIFDAEFNMRSVCIGIDWRHCIDVFIHDYVQQ